MQSISEGAALSAPGGSLGSAKELNNSHGSDVHPEEQIQPGSVLQPVNEDRRAVGEDRVGCRERELGERDATPNVIQTGDNLPTHS